MNNYFKFEPVVTLSALQTLASAVLLALAYFFAWPAVAIGLIAGVISATFLVLSTFVRGAVTPNATLEELKNLSQADQAVLRNLDQ